MVILSDLIVDYLPVMQLPLSERLLLIVWLNVYASQMKAKQQCTVFVGGTRERGMHKERRIAETSLFFQR